MNAIVGWFGRAIAACVWAVAWLGLTGAAVAQPTAPAYSVLHDFRGDLSAIWGGVRLAPDGSIYATTHDGGASNRGSVFVLRPDGSGGYANQTLHDFNGVGDDGASPAAGLLLASDGNLYGTTMAGGSNGLGTIFRVDGATGQVVTLHSFTNGDGANPQAGLIQASDGFLYGTTAAGGTGPAFPQGTAFKMDLAGTLTTLHVFTGSGGDGTSPLAALIQGSDGFFYGTTSLGGNTGEGTVFKMGPSGAVTVLHSFAGATEGLSPHGSLVERAGTFYGTTNNGGPNGWGTVFRIDASGALATVHAFAGVDGALPAAGLLLASDGGLYGTTSGPNSGTVFRISPADDFVTFHVFVGSDGARPQAGLVEGADGAFYGTTASSGDRYAIGQGTVFRIDASGTLATLYRFSGDAPAIPWGGLVQASDGVYGTSIAGGSDDYGALFRMTPAGAVSTLHSFHGPDGSAPFPALVEASDGNLYGVASEGGANDLGTVFRLEPSGTVTTLHEFGGSDGGTPRGRLIQASDGNLYGTTFRGGGIANVRGTVFRISLTGAFTLLHTFDGSDGGELLGGVIEGKDGNLYGTTSGGGANDKGAVFRIDPSGVFTPLHSFDGNDGWAPQAGLVEAADGNLYGTTAYGGLGGQGTLFRISSSGVPSVLHHFTFAEGQPYSRLLEASDGNLYGTTTLGATGYGSIFRVDSAGTVTVLHSCQPNDGAYPYGDLIQLNSGALWGVTYGGGAWNRGVAFELALGLTPPTAMASGSAKVCNGSAAPLSGSGGVSCSWSPVAGLDDPSSCTPSASPANTTTYTLTVTDAAGQRSVNKPTVTVTVDCSILSVSPKILDFGQVPLNKTKDLVLTVTNDTAAPAALSDVFLIEQSDPTPFDASAIDGCRSPGARILDPGASCTQTVRFWSVPGASAASPATMRLLDGNTFGTLATVTLLASTGPPDSGPNRPPVAVDDLSAVAPGFTLPLDPLVNDSDPDNDILRIVAVSDPPHGTATVAPCDSFPLNRNEDCIQYTSDAGYQGPDSFVYTISDGRGGITSATFHLAVGNLTPTVASVTPGSGPTAGGQSVRITGTNLLYRSDVAFLCGGGSTLPLTVTQVTDTEILAATPPAPAGTCDLQVRSPFGRVGQLGSAYTYGDSSSVTPTNGGLVSGTIVAVNTGPGDQTDPHVDGDLMTYTDVSSSQVRYYRFSTGVDLTIPPGSGSSDVSSDVSAGRISFNRNRSDGVAAMLFDTSTSTVTEIDPTPGSIRLKAAIGAGTVAFANVNAGNLDIKVWDLASNQTQVVGASPLTDESPSVSSDGQAVVWERCQPTTCDVIKAQRVNGAWNVSPVTDTPDPEKNPDSDGTWIVYEADRTGSTTERDIFLTPLAGGSEIRLALPGVQTIPHISRGVVSFVSFDATGNADLYVYVIATNTLYQVTNTPTISEGLNDVTVLPNGDIRVVWAANDGAAGDQNVYTTTFTPIAPGQATATSLTSSVNPSVSGHDVTFTATVTATTGAPTGSVTFSDGSSVLGTSTLAGGAATFTTSSLTVGTHAITAVYSGDATHAASTSPTLTETIDAPSSVSIVVTETIVVTDAPALTPSVMLIVPETITVTDTPTLLPSVMLTVPETITVTDAPAVNVPPVAQDVAVATTLGQPITITLLATDANNDPLAFAIVTGPGHGSLSAVVGNQVTYTPAFGYVGTDSFTFKANDGEADSNVATVSISIGMAATTTVLTSSPNPSVGGQSVTLTATVSAGGVTPTGEVEFSYPIPGAFRPPVVLGRVSLDASGVASLATTDLFPGRLVVTASYLGGGGWSPSSAFVIQNVAPAPTTTTLVSSNPTSLTTSPPVFTATVASTPFGTVTGQVEFFADGVSLGRSPVFTRNGSQIAVMGGATLAVGTHAITASYVGDTAHGASTSLALDHKMLLGTYFAIDLTPAFTDPTEAAAINESNWVVGFATHNDQTVGFPINAGFLYKSGLVDLGGLGGSSTIPFAINDAGLVVGQSTTATQQGHAFLYQNGSMTDLGTLGGATSRALALNSAGQIVGTADTGAGTHGFLYQNGAMADLGTLGGTDSAALAINADGFAAGFASLADGTLHAARYTQPWLDLGTLGGTSSRAAAINDAGQITGTSDLPGDLATHSFLWQGGSTTDLAGIGGPSNTAYAINDAGQVVGWTLLPGQTEPSHETPPIPRNAFLYSSAGFAELGTLSGGRSQAFDISNAGLLVGLSDEHAFVSAGGALTDLGTLGGPTSFARAINDRGVIVGSADIASGLQHAVAWLPVAASTLTLAPASGPAGGTTTLEATLIGFGIPIPNATITFTLNGVAAGSAITDASGVATLPNVPLAGLSAGTYPGAVHAVFTATSALGGSSATADLTVTPPPDHAPVAADDDYATGIAAALTVPAPGVLGNDTDIDGDPLTAVLVSGPSQGTLALNPDGSFTYTPNLGALGDSFTYQAVARGVPSNLATVRIGVAPDFQGLVSSSAIAINNGPGDQTEPHVDGDLVTYTDALSSNSSQIHYYRFSTGVDQGIPVGAPGELDFLSDVNAGRVAFSRLRTDGTMAALLFDLTTPTPMPTEIDPTPGSQRFGVAIGGDTVAFADFNALNGDIHAWDLATSHDQVVAASAMNDQNPQISTDGQTIVWERCAPFASAHCDVLKAQRVNGAWTDSLVTSTPEGQSNPDTDGTWIVYDGAASPTRPGIYRTPLAGGSEVHLAMPGMQLYPHISHGVISFVSIPPQGTKADLFVYVIATNKLYQVTDTPTVGESLNDVSVLPNGDIRVVWAADDDLGGNHNIYATTFNPGGADTTPPTVALTTPNGGERVFTGTPNVIRWSASDNVGVTAVDVAFSSNGGSTFAPIAGCTGLPGSAQSCTWSAPGPVTTQGRIRVTVRDAAGLTGSATSNANFSVVAGSASLTLTAPTTAVAWRIADTHAIRFTHNLGAGQKVSIDLSRDGGTTWSAINSAFVTTAAATGVFNWVVTGPPTTAARVRVTWSGNPTSVASASGVNFAILDRINLTAPDTAVTWPIGSTRSITWDHNLGVSETVNIDLSRDGGLTWNALATNVANATAATGRFNWVVTGPAATAARVRVSWAANPSVSSMSPVNFTISGTISTTAPTGAASWGISSQRTITWNHNLGAGQLFNITLSTDGGASFPTTLATGVSGGATSGSYAWVVSGPASATARVRVTWASSSAVAGTTGNFTMAAPGITLTAPNTAVNWAIGTTRTLTWTHNLGTQESVSIEESTNGGATWNPIATGIPNAGNATGSYDWLVPGPPSTTARVRVRWAANPAVAGQSAVNFTVANPFVTVTSPNTAVVWAIGSTHNITFNHNLGTGQVVTIALTRDGVTFTPLTTLTTTSATTGTFSWTVTGPGTTTARIRVTWSGNAAVTDVSNASFRIQ